MMLEVLERDGSIDALHVDEDMNGPTKLKKEIGVFQGVAIIVGVIVGSGIFISPVGVLKYTRSVGLSLTMWLVTGLFSTLGAIVYAELGVTIPLSGGEYIYILKTFGELPAFMCLWITFVVIGAASTAANSLVFASYILSPIFGDCDGIPASASLMISIFGLLTLSAINCYDVKWATKTAIFFSISKVAALLLIIFIGFYYIFRGSTYSFQDLFADSDYRPGTLSLAFYQGFWAYAGWNYLNFLTAEMKDPARSLPIAIVLSMILIIAIYLLANVAYLGVLSPNEMYSSDAVAVLFAKRTMGYFVFLIPVFVGASVFGSMNGEILSMSRLAHSGAMEGHMPLLLSMVSYKFLTPMPSVLIILVLSLCFQHYYDLFRLIDLTGVAFTLTAAMAVCCLLYLRYTQPNMERPFKLPIFVPILFLSACIFMLALGFYQNPTDSLLSLLIMLSGFPVYLVGVAWKDKPIRFQRAIDDFTKFCQKFLLVVPQQEGEESAGFHTMPGKSN